MVESEHAEEPQIQSESISRSVVSDSFVYGLYIAHQAPLSMGFSMQEYWSGQLCPYPEIFPTQGSKSGLPHCRQILYHLSHIVVRKDAWNDFSFFEFTKAGFMAQDVICP